MKSHRFAALMLCAVPLVPGASLFADEAPAFRPDPSLRSSRAPLAAPLRLAESLAVEPLARLAPAAVAAPAELAAIAERNRAPRGRHQVGFARELATPLRLEIEPTRLATQIGARVGGGFLSREPTGNYVWGTSVGVDDAKALRLELADVDVPAGTRFWVYGQGGEARSFDLRLLRGDRSIVSPTIAGDRIHLEVELPAGALRGGNGFAIRRVHEVLIPWVGASTDAPQADSCLQNGECYDSGDFAGIELARDSVFQYLLTEDALTYTCSGALLNDNVAATLEAWYLTANHCVPSQAVALTLDTAFFFRYNSCAGASSNFTLGPLGANLIVTSETTDVTLARAIDANDLPAGVVYSGWTSIRPGDNTVLHRLSHPVRDSDDTIQPQSYSTHRLDESPEFVCDGITTGNFLHTLNLAGTGISGGSSGSPIMLANGQIVGQLLGTCGSPPDGCGVDENVLDGAFATSYPLLRPYINPSSGEVCIPDADTACLLGGKFKVEVTWQTALNFGNAQVMYFNGERAENVESVFFWFFNGTNFEMGVKMVDACVPPFNRYWVFVSGLTSQGYAVTVTKMSTGEFQPYTNAVNEIPTTDADTDAFTCP